MTATMIRTGLLACPPRFGTPRNFDRATFGPQVGEVARRLGMPLMPWQQHVLDVALELDDDGGLFYSEVVLTAPRQNGKTAIVLSKLVHRANAATAFGGPQNIVYTAQDRNMARKKWLKDHVGMLRRSKSFREGRDYEVRLSNGSEAIEWKNGSAHGITAPTDTSVHGETLDEGVIDEAFAHLDDAVEQGMSPAMITRRNKQFFVLSTAGHARSYYLWRKVKVGRDLVHDPDARIAYFEWSAPDDCDPADPQVWRDCNPALGITITERAIRTEYERLCTKGEEGLRQFRRAHLNQWVEIPVLDDDINAVLPNWHACKNPASTIIGQVALAVDVTPDRQWTSIAAAGRNAQGVYHVELIDRLAGTSAAVARLVDLVAKHSPSAVALDAASPAGSILFDLEQAGVKVTSITARDLGQACGALFDDVAETAIAHLDDPLLNAAVHGAKRRDLGDLWAWDRKRSDVDISPLVAVTLARWVHSRSEEVVPLGAWR